MNSTSTVTKPDGPDTDLKFYQSKSSLIYYTKGASNDLKEVDLNQLKYLSDNMTMTDSNVLTKEKDIKFDCFVRGANNTREYYYNAYLPESLVRFLQFDTSVFQLKVELRMDKHMSAGPPDFEVNLGKFVANYQIYRAAVRSTDQNWF